MFVYEALKRGKFSISRGPQIFWIITGPQAIGKEVFLEIYIPVHKIYIFMGFPFRILELFRSSNQL